MNSNPWMAACIMHHKIHFILADITIYIVCFWGIDINPVFIFFVFENKILKLHVCLFVPVDEGFLC